MQNNSFSSLVRRYKSATVVGAASPAVVPLTTPLNPLNPLTPSTSSHASPSSSVQAGEQVSSLQNSYLVSHCTHPSTQSVTAPQTPSVAAAAAASHLAASNSLSNVFPSNSSASVAAAAAYRAYRATPYCYFYPGATDFVSATFDTPVAHPGSVSANANGEPEQCKVCGDYASGVHFGVLTCEGCKGFFKRNHRDATSSCDSKSTPLTCNRDQKCEINIASRNSCRSCRYRKCLSVGMSRDSIKLGRRSKNEKVILSKDCDKNSSRSNGLMTFISPRSLTTSLTPFASYNDLKSPLKPFVPGCSYAMTDTYLSPRNTGYPLSFDYPPYRPETNFYIPTQPAAGGIYSGMNPMEPINSFDLYSSASANNSAQSAAGNIGAATALNGVPPMANLSGSPSNILPSVHMPKHQSEASNLNGQQKLANHNTAAVSDSPEGYSSSNDTSSAQSNSLMTSPFLSHQVVSSGHGFFGANQDIPVPVHVPSFNTNSVAQGLHNAVDSYNSSCSWSIMDHIATF